MYQKKFQFLALCLLVLSGVAVKLSADEVEQVKVTVPFSFRVGSTVLPAGDYTVVQENQAGLVLIEGRGGSAMMITRPGSSTSPSAQPGLRFESSAQGEVLSEIRLSGKASEMVPVKLALLSK